MTPASRIQGILFDSGGTLVRPIAGSWYPGHRFREIVDSWGVGELDWGGMDQAADAGNAYLDANHHLSTEDEEREQFQNFYDILLRGIGLDRPDPDLTYELASVLAHGQNMEAYPDTHEVLGRLQGRGLALGILSNTWPSLDRKYRELGLRDFFEVFVMSAPLGLWKPDEGMYQAAIDAMGLPPERMLFVDDLVENVEAARALGLNGVVISRDGQPPEGDAPWVSSLAEIEGMLGEMSS